MISYNKAFPEEISQGVLGGPVWRTDVTELRSGSEYRNTPWSEPLYQYDASMGLRYDYELVEFTRFFYNTQGMLKSFRFKDWSDFTTADDHRYGYTSSDEFLGTGDGTTYWFRLYKSYGDYTRRIWNPRVNRLSIAFDGDDVDQDLFFVDESNGTVVFLTAPASGVKISWGGEFDVHARFDSDHIPLSMKLFNLGEVPSIPIKGVRTSENVITADYDEIRTILTGVSKTSILDLSKAYDYTVGFHWKGFWEYKNLVL